MDITEQLWLNKLKPFLNNDIIDIYLLSSLNKHVDEKVCLKLNTKIINMVEEIDLILKSVIDTKSKQILDRKSVV